MQWLGLEFEDFELSVLMSAGGGGLGPWGLCACMSVGVLGLQGLCAFVFSGVSTFRNQYLFMRSRSFQNIYFGLEEVLA